MRNLLILLFAFQSLILFSQEKSTSFSRENFNNDWKFERFGPHPEEPGKVLAEPKGLEAKAYNDNNWRSLNLPHDWSIEGPFRNDLENNTGLLPWKGIGWYRKHFNVSENDKEKQLFIDFDGAMANAQVWLNGKFVGEWPYGYTTFRFNLTPYVDFGKDNVIAVRLDTEKFDSRWYPGAGIYRNVWLTKTNQVHIDHWGTYITTPKITEGEATVDIQVTLKNSGNKNSNIKLKTVIYNSDKKEVATSKTLSSSLSAQSEKTIGLGIVVEKPLLWDTENPNLYQARTYIYEADELVHEEITSFGFRTLDFTANEGFLLNGKTVEIKGVCLHHDLGPLGASFNTRAAERQLEILKEMGCNSIRTSHNPPAPEVLDLCDKMGILVQVEAFDTWQKGKMENDYHINFDTWHVEDLRAMVLRDRNHPSVFMWSIGNEVPDQGNPELAKKLANIVRMTDPTRPVTAGCDWGDTAYNGFSDALDVFGYNYNQGSYEKFFKTPELNEVPFIANETSSCLSSRGEYFFPVEFGPANDNLPGFGIFQMSSYDTQYPGWGSTADMQFKLHDQYPRIMGEYVWTGFDYLGEPTPYNSDITNLLYYKDPAQKAALKKHLDELKVMVVPSRSSYFGIMDLCGFKKDRFYLYQARWRPDFPMAHILPHWNWSERIGKNVPVHVYTSGNEAELFLNGKSLGKKKKGEFEYRIMWDEVVYKPGELKVKVWKNGKAWAEDIVKTTAEASKISLVADRKKIIADGKDLVFVTVNIEDKDNQLVPKSDNIINFEIEGPGEIIAVGNGDPTSHEPFIAKKHSAFNGKCLVIIRSTKQAGTIKLKAQSKGLKDSRIEIQVRK
ncbi:DUF4982 domain-containing protein [Aequorivita sp. H23M31]|uniref:DUF4982 domain-containing protein n=1 Tax=Aequorivita ciconiae TaxID=2494375 RepID=A0A410FZK0_9FLAO|nr:beta-galactosidase GalB [Aequorivita sp. H23M31]QAA80444.1 DUF4982 domain-containing protein [Aequorivita sp. H23M31]